MYKKAEKSGIIIKYSFFNMYQGIGYLKILSGGYHG